jgi:hypothetical protein
VRGVERVDDRRVISGIVHILKIGCRWRDCPPEYGPPTTIYNRFVRWARHGSWENLFRKSAPIAETGVLEIPVNGNTDRARDRDVAGEIGAGDRRVDRRLHSR